MNVADSQTDILAIHSGALGDLLLFGRLLHQIPGSVRIICGADKGPLLEGLGMVQRWMNFESLPMHEAFSSTRPKQCALGKLVGTHRRLVSCFAEGNPVAEKRLTQLCGAQRADFLPIRPAEQSDVHLLNFWRSELGLSASGAETSFSVPESWRSEAHRLLPQTDKPVVTIHPGSGGTQKCWALRNYLRLAEQMRERNLTVVFLLGPVERERFSNDTRSAIRKRGCLLQDLSTSQLAGVLSCSSAYVGNDSGVSHLAGTVGVSTVALFGATSAEQFAPQGPLVRTLQRDAMEEIKTSQVLAQVLDILGSVH